MVVTRDGGVPVVSHASAGDRPDVTQVTAVIDELLARYRDLRGQVESLTVVDDAGQNSAGNHARIEQAGIGFVGSLPAGDHPALLAVPRSRHVLVDADRFPGLRCMDTTVTALGVTRRAVLTHSPTLHTAQSRGVDQTLGKARRRLAGLKARLARGHTRRDRQAVEAEITTILRPRWVAEVITATPPVRCRPGCGCGGTPTRPPAGAWSSGSSARGSCSPTVTPGPPPRWSPPTAPSPSRGRVPPAQRPAPGNPPDQRKRHPTAAKAGNPG
jgi:hypothetical protein